jgi:hypothetical protein
LQDAGWHALGTSWRAPSVGRWSRQPVQVRVRGVVELQSAGERAKHVLGGVLVAALFQPYVVVDADARQEGQFLAAQAGDAPAAEVGNADLLGPDLFTPRPQELSEGVVTAGACAHDFHRTVRLPASGWPCHYQGCYS